MSRITLLIIVLAGLGLAASPSTRTLAAGFPYYLPLVAGNEAWYADARTGSPAFRVAVAGFREGAAILTRTPWGTAAPDWSALVTAEPDGDVFVLAESIGDEPFVPFAEPMPILDAPLEPGRSWSVGWEDCAGSGPGPVYSWSVDAVEDVVVPAGRFRCQRVRSHVNCSVAPPDTYWYADGVGLVKAICSGCGFGPDGPPTYEMMAVPVAAEPVTWGRVKALFR